MISERQRGFYSIYVVIQGCLIFVSFVLWFFVFELFYHKNLSGGLANYFIYLVVLLGALFVTSAVNASSDQPLLLGKAYSRFRMGMRQAFILAAALGFFTVATKDQSISRLFLFTYIPVFCTMLALCNAFLPRWLLSRIFKGGAREKCLLMRSDDFFLTDDQRSPNKIWGRKILEWLKSQQDYGLEIVGYLGESLPDGISSEINRAGGSFNFREGLLTTGATSLILIGMPNDGAVLNEIIDHCERQAVRLSVIQDFERNFGRPVTNFQIDGVNLLQFRSEPLQNPLRRVAKRLLDIMISLPIVVFVLPSVALFVRTLQLLHAPGSLIFKQPRNGRDNTIFEVYKFRTMYADNHEPAEQAKQGDKRIYKGGASLRKYSIDELPQFINVLKGEMSIVGPRPHMPEHNSAWEIHYRPYHVRSMVRPGITGLAQTRGLRGEVCSDEEIKARVQCDIEYIENWSLLFDIGIIIKTLTHVVNPPLKAI